MPLTLVTGASRGLGLEFVKQILAKGAGQSVLAACRNPEGAKDLQTLSASNPGRLTLLQLDVSDYANVAKATESVPSGLDLLINNAGILHYPETHADPIEQQISNAQEAFGTNVCGLMAVSNALLPKMAEGGKVVMIGSLMGSIQNLAHPNCFSYRMSKAAVNMYAKCLAKDEATQSRKVTVLTLHPGHVQTDMGTSGGRSAPLTPQESIEGMLNTITARQMEDSGGFFDYKNEAIAW